jgi:hypothetical protein
LLLAARPAEGLTPSQLALEDDLEQMARDVAAFEVNISEKIAHWRRQVLDRTQRGERVVLWGALSKAVSLLTTLGLDRGTIEYVVDISPYRHGKCMPGTGQKIVSPAFLADYQPNLVIAMNPIYLQEIRRDLDTHGCKSELVAV